jgi:hypothetical protein
MNLVFSTTGYQDFNSHNVLVTKENVKTTLVIPNEKLSSVFVDLAFHLLKPQEVDQLLTNIFNNLEKDGTLKIHCLDLYELSQKIHRREIDEPSANNILYGFGQENCLSTMFYISVCSRLGFKKKTVSFESIIAKMEFVK